MVSKACTVVHYGERLTFVGRYLQFYACYRLGIEVHNRVAAPFQWVGDETWRKKTTEARYIDNTWHLVALAEHIASQHVFGLAAHVVGGGELLSFEQL